MRKKIPVADGIRQGDSLRPILFNLLKGYTMGHHSIKIICYADDAVLIADDEDDLQRMLYKFEQIAKKFNMTISVQKNRIPHNIQGTKAL